MQNVLLWIFIDWGGWFGSEENNLEEFKDNIHYVQACCLRKQEYYVINYTRS